MLAFPPLQRRTTNSGASAYRTSGVGSPVVLLHGWGASSRYWVGAPQFLTAQRTLIAPDLPGFGAGEPPSGPTTLNSMVRHVIDLADAMGLERFALVGHSLGAGVALLLAAHYPERVDRLALVSFGLPRDRIEALTFAWLHIQQSVNATFWAPWLTLWRPWLALSQPWREQFWSMPPLPQLLAAPLVKAPVQAEMLQAGVLDLAQMDVRVALESAATNGDPQVLQAAATVRAPTAVINGEVDPLFPPESAKALTNTLDLARMVVLPNCGHVPMAEAPEPFYAFLSAFLLA
ncbi:MAG: alpha/beta hydrolase [Oscillochloris sp.]|nr:alpha/beta hydrolase [Oscillochloris sp.]